MYKCITKSLSHPIDSALRLHFSRRNDRVTAEVCPVVYFAGTPVAIAITVRLRLCPPKPSASLHPGASRHPFTWPWAAMGSGGHSLQPSSFRFDCTLSRLSATAEAGMKRSGIDRPGAAGVIRGQSPRKSALSSLRPRLAEATAVRALAIVDTVATLSSPPPRLRHSLHHCITAIATTTSSSPLSPSLPSLPSSLSQSPFSPIVLKKVYCRGGG